MKPVLCLTLTIVLSIFMTSGAMASTKTISNEQKKSPLTNVSTTENYTENETLNKVISYENILSEINQIKSFIAQGLYLEAIQECEQTKSWHNISHDDSVLLDSLKSEAQNRYDRYIAEQNKWQTYYDKDWGMGFKALSSYKPTHTGSRHTYREYITIYNNTISSLTIFSYKIGLFSSDLWTVVYSPSQIITKYTSLMNSLARQGDGYGGYFEILSQNNTTVGSFPAVQVTIRYTENLNRYGTKTSSTICRCTAFQYGNWLYAIKAQQEEYLWTDDFWDLMESVRTSIAYY